MTHSEQLIDGQDNESNARVQAALAYYGSSDHLAYKEQRLPNHGESVIAILNEGFDYMQNGGTKAFMETLV